ncbi:MAG TPA: energy transducer TonB [Terriglobales bacterium]|nr:energy transducer TonB [Terriglobales bacterium]
MTKRTLIVLMIAGLFCLALAEDQQAPEQKPGTATVEELEGLPYPYIARLSGFGGRVVVLTSLDDAGRVTKAEAIPKLGRTEEMLTNDTLANALRWRFRPNSQKGAVIVYDFRMVRCTEAEVRDSVPSTFHFQAPTHVTITACPFPT